MQCTICKNDFENEDLFETENELVCYDCREENASRCTKCDNYFYHENLKTHRDDEYCEDCYDFHVECHGNYYSYYGVSQKDFL